MKDKIETDKIWIDVETLAILKNITKRAVRLSLNKNKYEYIIENVKGGKTYKIKLSSIEENYQKKYIQEISDIFNSFVLFKCDFKKLKFSNLFFFALSISMELKIVFVELESFFISSPAKESSLSQKS